ncbi:MAG TPA: hypothetical protein VE987_13545, partial [Polyangiaceae bacterium]|nr:hypothetical protein [Polyangiaceae bacterium]
MASRTEVLVVFLDGEGRVLQFGQSVDARLGEPRVLQEDAFEQLFADGAARVREAFLSATCDQPVELEAEVKARDGRARAVNWWCFRHDVSVSAPARYFAIGIDRTEERELERRALQNARAAAGGVLAA